MRKFLFFWKFDPLELKLQKQSVLCDWLLTLVTFVASLSIVDALFTSRFTKKIAAVKPVPHSDYLIPEASGGGIVGFLDTQRGKMLSVGEVSGSPAISIVWGKVFIGVVVISLLLLLIWKLTIITQQFNLKSNETVTKSNK